MYVYETFEKGLFTVGFYQPNGKWVSESDHGDKDKACERVAFLNGDKSESDNQQLVKAIKEQTKAITDQSALLNAAVMQMANILEVIASPDEDLDDISSSLTSLDQRG